MAGDQMHAFRHMRADIADDGGLDRTDVADDGAALQSRPDCLCKRFESPYRRAQDDKISVRRNLKMNLRTCRN
jgi:hypothetical protein